VVSEVESEHSNLPPVNVEISIYLSCDRIFKALTERCYTHYRTGSPVWEERDLREKMYQRLSLKEGRLTMSWIFLGIAILLETTGTTCMKLSEGFSKLVPSVLLFIFYGLSFALLTVVMKRINLSIAYAIWSGAGTALIATVGVLWFKEPVTAVKIVSLVLIIAGVVGLRLTGGE
jgi:small multidrug resistance pump